MLTLPAPLLGTTVGVATPSSVPLSSVPLGLFSRKRSVSPAIRLLTVPLTAAPGRMRDGDVVRVGAPTVADVFALSGPRQPPCAGTTAQPHVPGGVAVWVHVVPETIAAQLPLAIVCRTVPAESYRRIS